MSHVASAEQDSERLVRWHSEGRGAVIWLCRADRNNSLVPSLLRAFIESLGEIRRELPSLAWVELRAEGDHFSTGGDVRAFYEAGEQRQSYADELVGLLNQAIIDLISFPVPVVIRVQGYMTGGSFGFLLASDFVFIEEDTSVSPYYTEVGFSPDGGWSAILPMMIGIRKTKEVQLLNSSLGAKELFELGLAYKVVSKSDMDKSICVLRENLESKIPSAVMGAKHSILAQSLYQIKAALELEKQQFVAQIASDQAIAGMRRFLKIDDPLDTRVC